jgi:hypothetical protein
MNEVPEEVTAIATYWGGEGSVETMQQVTDNEWYFVSFDGLGYSARLDGEAYVVRCTVDGATMLIDAKTGIWHGYYDEPVQIFEPS